MGKAAIRMPDFSFPAFCAKGRCPIRQEPTVIPFPLQTDRC